MVHPTQITQLAAFFTSQPSLNFSSSSPHIFSSTFGLLQQWSNTFYPYGHSIVPCEIPINTNLYHARIDSDLPPSPEWFAFDAAMSYAIAGTLTTSHLLTYRTTKTVKAIYFDGSSAALNGQGNMDSQMVLIFNNSDNVPDNPVFGPDKPNNHSSGDPHGGFLGAEYDRADALCAFIRDRHLGGKGWGYEGIVRMNAGFELIWCDFDSPSVRLVSQLNSSVPSFEPGRGMVSSQDMSMRHPSGLHLLQHPLTMQGRSKTWPQQQLRSLVGSAFRGWQRASANLYGFVGGIPGRGEARVKLDSCGIWSFYDGGLKDQEQARVAGERKCLNISASGDWNAPTNKTERATALQALQRRRRSHRADHISETDGIFMLRSIEPRLRALLEPTTSDCSGIDWHEISEEVVIEYSSSLQELLGLLTAVPTDVESNYTSTWKWLIPVRESIHLMMMPYYSYPSHEAVEASPEDAFSLGASESMAAFGRCSNHYLPLMQGGLADSEMPIYSATLDILQSICRVVLSLSLSVDTMWYTSFDNPHPVSSKGISRDIGQWTRSIEELMAWLGWAEQWTACDPGCGPAEICWIPIWPLTNIMGWGGGGGGGGRGRGGGGGGRDRRR